MNRIILIILVSTLSSCATMSNRTKTIVTSIGAGIVAGTIAANLAPKDENPIAHAAVWGGSTAAATAIVGLFIFDEQSRSYEFERKLQVSESELAVFRSESKEGNHLLYDSESALGRDLPSEYKSLVRPGKWSIYRINQWISQGENNFVHQDKIIRIEPPQFQPSGADLSQSTINNEGENKQ